LQLYSTDDLRRLYLAETGSLIRSHGGIFSRAELAAIIRRRVWREQFGYAVLLVLSVIAALAAVIAAYEGRATLR
jgi:hypothetical protein